MKVKILPQTMEDLNWWLIEENLISGCNLEEVIPDFHIFSDASKKGWGAHLSDMQASGTWPQALSREHINNLELRALGWDSKSLCNI
mgnify:CR=1 FL=1